MPVPRLGTETIRLGIAEHDDPHHAFTERLFEVIECALVAPNARGGDSEIVRRHGLMPRALDQLGKDCQCARMIASTCSRAPSRALYKQRPVVFEDRNCSEESWVKAGKGFRFDPAFGRSSGRVGTDGAVACRAAALVKADSNPLAPTTFRPALCNECATRGKFQGAFGRPFLLPQRESPTACFIPGEAWHHGRLRERGLRRVQHGLDEGTRGKRRAGTCASDRGSRENRVHGSSPARHRAVDKVERESDDDRPWCGPRTLTVCASPNLASRSG